METKELLDMAVRVAAVQADLAALGARDRAVVKSLAKLEVARHGRAKRAAKKAAPKKMKARAPKPAASKTAPGKKIGVDDLTWEP